MIDLHLCRDVKVNLVRKVRTSIIIQREAMAVRISNARPAK